jgi:hypothetical protein
MVAAGFLVRASNRGSHRLGCRQASRHTHPVTARNVPNAAPSLVPKVERKRDEDRG